MTGRLIKKLNSQRGISMVIAMVFLLFCVVIGSATLTAASAAAGRLSADAEYQRAYLAVSSAAGLVKEDLRGLSFTGAYLHNDILVTTATVAANEFDQSGEPISSSSVAHSESYAQGGAATCFSTGSEIINSSGIDLSGIYYSSLESGVKSAIGSFPTPEECSCSLSFSGELLSVGSGTPYELPEVNGTLTVGTDYTLTVWLEDSESKSGILMTYLPVMTSAVSSRPPAYIISGPNDNTATQTTATQYSTVISWAEPVITLEGGAA